MFTQRIGLFDRPPRNSAECVHMRMITACQQIQRENPYGSKASRDAHKRMREVYMTWQGKDIGEYE